MTSGLVETVAHPLASLVSEVAESVERHAGGPAWTLSAGEVTRLLPDLDVAIRRLEAVRLRLLREADRHGVGVDAGHTSTATWWARTTVRTRPEAHRQVALAASLDDDAHAPVATAVGAGAVSPGQAAVIIDA